MCPRGPAPVRASFHHVKGQEDPYFSWMAALAGRPHLHGRRDMVYPGERERDPVRGGYPHDGRFGRAHARREEKRPVSFCHRSGASQ